jgi:hypothetical protein
MVCIVYVTNVVTLKGFYMTMQTSNKDEIIDKDEVLKMAREAGNFKSHALPEPWIPFFEAFAKLVYDRGWRDGYTSCDNDNKTLTSALIEDAVEEEREACLDVIETHRIPVGNSAAGEMACEWTYEALKEIVAKIRARGNI